MLLLLILLVWLTATPVVAIQEKSTPESEKTPPLVRVVYRAARANKAKQALEYLAQAGQLIEQKADVNAEGPDGRTALHWVVLGAMDAEKDKLRQSYIELAERLLEHGAKVDCEDHYGKTRHREIVYAPGVEMTLRVTAPVKLAEMAKASTPLDLPVSKALADLANEQPLRTNTPNGIPSDITNVLLLGAREKIEAAFRAAGWEEGNALSLNSGFKTFVAAAESKGCKEEPVSVLLLDGRKADLIWSNPGVGF